MSSGSIGREDGMTLRGQEVGGIGCEKDFKALLFGNDKDYI